MVPKHFFVLNIIEKRKPLASTARRAGWVGSNILLSMIPERGKIHIVKDSLPVAKDNVVERWSETIFLRNQNQDARGWLIDVLRCVESLGKPEFGLDEVYGFFEGRLAEIYPQNRNVRPKIRQQLQFLRNQGMLEFMGRGRY